MAPAPKDNDTIIADAIKGIVTELNAALQTASHAGLKVDIDVITRHHIGIHAAPTIQATVSRQI